VLTRPHPLLRRGPGRGTYLIIGQGISGTLLSRALMKAGKKVIVIDDGNISTSSKVASGVINPVTGKRLVRTWMIEELLPFAQTVYEEIGKEFGVPLISQCNILDFYASRDAAQGFNDKLVEEKDYLSQSGDETKWSEYFRFNYGIGEINPCMLVDIGTMLNQWRDHLISKDALVCKRFHTDDCEVGESSVRYGDITADKIIFCDGAASAENPFFNKLPWSKDKGEALIAEIPGLPATNIYKQGINIVPWRDGLFWIGATHDWKYTDVQPSPAFRKQTEELLTYWLKLPYRIVDHLVAQRPVNMDRKPFVGLHPANQSVGIFNGLGTKGCSVAPYFAEQFAQHLVNGTTLMPDVDVKRFSKILNR